MSLQFKKIAPHVVHINEAKLLVNVVLRNIDVEVVVSILVQTRGLRPRSHITCHRVSNYGGRRWAMLSNNLGQGGVLPIGYVVKHWKTSRSTKHTENSINFTRKHCAFAKFLPTQACLVNLNGSRQPHIWQNLSLNEHGTALSD